MDDSGILRRIERDGGAVQVQRLWLPPEDPEATAILGEMEFPRVEEIVLRSAGY